MAKVPISVVGVRPTVIATKAPSVSAQGVKFGVCGSLGLVLATPSRRDVALTQTITLLWLRHRRPRMIRRKRTTQEWLKDSAIKRLVLTRAYISGALQERLGILRRYAPLACLLISLLERTARRKESLATEQVARVVHGRLSTTRPAAARRSARGQTVTGPILALVFL